MPVVLTIFYVEDVSRSTRFYDELFGWKKTVEVPVYTEYELSGQARFGLMDRRNAAHFSGGHASQPDLAKAELYLSFPKVEPVLQKLGAFGVALTSELGKRDWGDNAAYFLDPDGYVVAVAESG